VQQQRQLSRGVTPAAVIASPGRFFSLCFVLGSSPFTQSVSTQGLLTQLSQQDGAYATLVVLQRQ
jgi:hypothetical protein